MNTTTNTNRTAEAQAFIDSIASTLNGAGLNVALAVSTIAQISERIGLLEGHLQCRDFTAQPWAKENIEAELREKKQAQKEMLAFIGW